MPKISIIIPLYNKQQYIEQCVETLLCQSFMDYEIIIVDDGSTDSSGMIVDDLSERHEQVQVIHQINQGVSGARNNGLKVAQGEWIWFIDADDIPEPDWYVEIINQVDEYDIILGNFEKCSNDGKKELVEANVVGRLPWYDLPEAFMKQQYQTGFFGYLWCKLIRRSFIEQVGARFQQGLTLAEDLQFMVELYRKGHPRIYFLPQVALHYQLEAENSSREKIIDYKAQLQIQLDIYHWLLEANTETNYIQRMQGIIANYVAFVFFYAYEEKQNIQEEIKWLNDRTDLLDVMLVTEDVSGMIKKIAVFAMKHQYTRLVIFLKCRYSIRKVYRAIRGR